jgi:hypothetical protein
MKLSTEVLFYDDTSAAEVEHRLQENRNKRSTSKNFWTNFRSSSQQNKEEKIHIYIYQQKQLDFDVQSPNPPDHAPLDIYLWENHIHYCLQL